MRKVFKIFIASFTALILSVLSSCWLDAAEHMDLTYNTVEEFVVDFGAKLEKRDNNDACCLFEYEAIKTSVEQNLQCSVTLNRVCVHVIRLGGDLKPIRYQFESFECTYALSMDDEIIGMLSYCCVEGEVKGEVVDEGVEISNLKLCIKQDYWPQEIFFKASFQELNTQVVLGISIEEQFKNDFTVGEFIAIITPIIESRYWLI